MMIRKLLIIAFSMSLGISSVYAEVDPWKQSYRLEKTFQYDAAISALKSIGTDNEMATLRRGWLNYSKGSYSKSIDYYKKAIIRNKNSLDARLGIILPLLEQQRWREAALNAGKVIEIAPWNYYAHVRLMRAEEALKQWDKLSNHAESVHQYYPVDATVLVYLARAKYKLGDKKAAKLYYSKALEIVPDNFEAKHFSK